MNYAFKKKRFCYTGLTSHVPKRYESATN